MVDIDIPMPLVKSNALRAVALTVRYTFTGQEWQSMYLYMCCRMALICEAYVDGSVTFAIATKSSALIRMTEHDVRSEGEKTRFLNNMAQELVSRLLTTLTLGLTSSSRGR